MSDDYQPSDTIENCIVRIKNELKIYQNGPEKIVTRLKNCLKDLEETKEQLVKQEQEYLRLGRSAKINKILYVKKDN